jgi:hypothetical protein
MLFMLGVSAAVAFGMTPALLARRAVAALKFDNVL